MVKTLIKILIVAVVLNLIYELLHSRLYKTCLEASFKKYWFLMIKACIFDGIAITIIYYFSQLFPDYLKLIIFSVATLAFAYFWELHSIKKGKWEYSKNMPVVFGVGVTPLFQLFLTGMVVLYICKAF